MSTEHDMEPATGAELSPEAAGMGGEGTLRIMPGVDAAPAARGRAPRRTALSVDQYADGVLAGDRVILGRAISLIESARPEHNETALRVLERLLPHTGRAIRVGITGIPGAGKSTFIDAMGSRLVDEGHRLAVLAIDPSSTISKGSIMGDKTRMERLAASPRAFIRPSPTAGSLGGVARKTREVMLLCEAAGFDVVFIETVGVGQSETLVSSMVDFFLLLMIAGAGDELQGIKRGIMELAHAVVVTKADGGNELRAQQARMDYEHALHLLASPAPSWTVPVLTCSSVTGDGLGAVWDAIASYRTAAEADGHFQRTRSEQALAWMRDTINQYLLDAFLSHSTVAALLPDIERDVAGGRLPALTAAGRLLDLFLTPSAVAPRPPSITSTKDRS